MEKHLKKIKTAWNQIKLKINLIDVLKFHLIYKRTDINRFR